MILLKNFSIKHKLVLIIFSTSLVAVIAGFSIVIVVEYRTLKEKMVHDALLKVKLISEYCITPLDFRYNEEAEVILSKLESIPAVYSAVLFDLKGEPFARFDREHYIPSLPNLPEHETESIFDGQWLHIFRTISFSGRKMGTLYFQISTADLYKDLSTLCLTLSIIAFTMIVSIYFLAFKMQSIISKPILELADISKQISINDDYSVHLQPVSRNEIGILYTNFNSMIRQIQSRTHELKNEIAERKRVEDARVRLASAIEQTTDSVIITDKEGVIQYVNPSFEQLTGYSTNEVLGKNPRFLKSGRHDDGFYQEMWKTLLRGKVWKGHLINKKKDGDLFEEEAIINPVYDTNGNLINYVAVKRDVTERIQAEEERKKLAAILLQSQKMESIGTLAGGIAHDFNNILTPIFGYLDLAMLRTQADSELTAELNEVRKAADRARELVKQILTFSRRESEELAPTQVHIVVKEALKLLRASIPTTIEIRQNIDTNCGSVLANPTQIHQLLMNLCTNAYHAMHDTGGVLGVSLAPLKVSTEDLIKNIHMQPGYYLKLEVSDTGCGMEKETLDRIFEPYFTTKAKGEGTGMGLSVIHGIVKNLGGHITVYSEPGRGSVFHIYLPVAESSIIQKATSCEGLAPRGTERIMLIDDEEAVRKAEKDILTSLGYNVSAFSSPLEALEQFATNPDAFDLVITDMTMPKMTGDKLAKEIMSIRSDLPVILCTGFSDLTNEESVKAIGIREYISKPVTRQPISRIIRNVLDGVKK